MPVHAFGQPADMDPILEVAQSYGLTVIEDACEAIGAEYKGKKAGSFGEISTFSFYATKNITTGEGGMILTNDDEKAEQSRLFRNHGQVDTYKHKSIGYNFRMTNISAAMGLVQMKKLEQFNEKRIENARFLSESLSGVEGIEVPDVSPEVKHVFHQYAIKIKNGKREQLIEALKKEEIESRVFYPTIYLNEPYQKMGYGKGLCPVSERLSGEALSLPVHPLLSREDLEKIVKTVKENI